MDFSYDINFRNSIGTVSTELALKPINNFKDNFIVFYRSIDFFLIQTKINEHAIKWKLHRSKNRFENDAKLAKNLTEKFVSKSFQGQKGLLHRSWKQPLVFLVSNMSRLI